MDTVTKRTAHVKACLGCGAELLFPELDGALCYLCSLERDHDMKTASVELAEVKRQRDLLLAALERLLDECNPFATDVEWCECGENGSGFDDDGNPCEHIQACRAIAVVKK